MAKFYFFMVFFVVAIVGTFIKADDDTTIEYICPDSKPVISCPGGNNSRCSIFCDSSVATRSQPKGVRYLCLNTNPPMMCISSDWEVCTRYCRGAAKATSLPLAGGDLHT